MRTLALAALLAFAATGSGNAAEPAPTPHVAEFGGTFGSDLGGIVLARDGTVWVNENDRIAHVSRNGSVREYRLPIDVYPGRPSAAGPIGIGPGGDAWFDCRTCVGRISAGGRIRLGGIMPRNQRYLTAFTVSPKDVSFAYFDGIAGVVHLNARGAQTTSDTDLERISGVAAAADGALWIVASSRMHPETITIYRRPPGGERQRVSDVLRSQLSVSGTDRSGALVTTRFDWTAHRSTVARIEPDGRTTTVSDFALEGYGLQAGGVAFPRDGSTWIAQTGRHRLVRIAPGGAQREFRRGLPDTAGPYGIAADDAGGAWFTDVSDNLVGHVAANGTITTIGHGPIPESTPALPVVASDGAVWYRESFDWRRRLARLAPDGTLREFANVGSGPLLARGRDVLASTPQGIVAVAPDGTIRTVAPSVTPTPAPPGYGTSFIPFASAAATAPDGAAWFAVDRALARIDRDGAVRTIPIHALRPDSIAFDASGTLWFTETVHSLIGSVAPDGRVSTHTRGLTRWNSGPQWIARGPDGAMWFTEVRDRIGRVASDGTITEFPAGIPHRSSLGGIVTGPDGALWFTLWHGNVLGRMTTDGQVTLHRGLVTPSRGNEHDPDSILVPDGHRGFWFPESQGGRVAHLTFR